MMRTLAIVLSLVVLGTAYLNVPPVAAEACDPYAQDNTGCCDRDPEREDCCAEPNETQYVHSDGTYECLDCDPQPTSPLCCPQNTTWWEYPDGRYECIPYSAIVPMPESASADVAEEGVGECRNEAWAEQTTGWLATMGDEQRARCISHEVGAQGWNATVYYDTRYGSYGVLLDLPSAGANSGAQVSSYDLAITGYSGIGTDCEGCPPPWLTLASCTVYYDGSCYALPVDDAIATTIV